MISLKRVTFGYGDNRGGEIDNAVEQIDLEIRDGEYVAVMGRNSSGKTTLARCLNALIIPDEGEITIDGIAPEEYEDINAIRKKIGMVFQNPENQIVSTTVEREVAFGLENLGVPTDMMRQVVDGTLARFDLEKYRKHPPHLLSGGEKQRLALAAVMAMNPKYLVLDEPTAMLDPKSRRELLTLLKEIKEDNRRKKVADQITIIVITQFAEEALDADRLIVLEKGQIVYDDAPDIVFQNVEHLKEIGLEVPVEFEVGQMLVEQGYSIEPLKYFK
ncbi:ATP-binding cassette domain-containing protein [candidate division KSB1 bacterium]|nr:ATP-binding cassette domain-containing protein [candidate division KSB1 bacterium]